MTGVPPVYDPLDENAPELDRSGVPRDRWKRALLFTREGEGPVPYTSASTLADTLNDEWGLSIWDRRMIAKGVGMDRELAALAGSSTYSTGFGKPDRGTNREQGRILDEVCDRARDRAKAHEKRDWGSALHAFTEDRDPLGEPPEEMEADVASFWEALDLAGIEVVATEVFVANDTLMSAGTGDHLVRVPWRPDKLVWLDKKTGVYHPESVPIQLTVYAGGDPYEVDDEGVHRRFSFAEQFGMEVDQEYGITAHVPAMEGRTVLYPENLVEGLEAAHHAIWQRAWHKAHRKPTPIDIEEIARRDAGMRMLQASLADPTLAELKADLQRIHKQYKAVWTPELTAHGKALIADNQEAR